MTAKQENLRAKIAEAMHDHAAARRGLKMWAGDDDASPAKLLYRELADIALALSVSQAKAEGMEEAARLAIGEYISTLGNKHEGETREESERRALERLAKFASYPPPSQAKEA